MHKFTKWVMGVASLAAITGAMPASAALVTDPNDARNWQGATVSTFAGLYGLTNQQVVDNELLDDNIIDTTGWISGTLVANAGGGGCLGTSTDLTGTSDYGYFCGGGAVSIYANAVDNLWFQTDGIVGQTVFDLGFNANKAAIFNTIDHGPLPEEAIESTVYLSDSVAGFAGILGTDYILAVVERVFLEGFHPNIGVLADTTDGILWDGFSYIVGTGTSATFRYASITHGGPGSLIQDGDNEINGIMGLRADNTGCTIGVDCDNPGTDVPEPITLSLLGAGLFGIGALRRRRA
ncbi:MAG: PEP-CTERM sorting domain-containing protein [Alphaproteobacteria bacterium]